MSGAINCHKFHRVINYVRLVVVGARVAAKSVPQKIVGFESMIYGSNNSPPPFHTFNNSRNFCGLLQDFFKNRESIVFHFHVSFCFPRSK